MLALKTLLQLLAAYLAAWLAAYFAVQQLRPSNTHSLAIFGLTVPGGELASAILTFSWAFFLVIIGMAMAYQRIRTRSRS